MIRKVEKLARSSVTLQPDMRNVFVNVRAVPETASETKNRTPKGATPKGTVKSSPANQDEKVSDHQGVSAKAWADVRNTCTVSGHAKNTDSSVDGLPANMYRECAASSSGRQKRRCLNSFRQLLLEPRNGKHFLLRSRVHDFPCMRVAVLE